MLHNLFAPVPDHDEDMVRLNSRGSLDDMAEK
jgi:hypothetical protein